MTSGRKSRKKPKYEFTIPGQHPFGMAAVWKLWKNPKTDHWEKTFAVLTGEPNELMTPIHDRMTTFLEPRDHDEYLAPAERPPVHLLRILPASKMKARLSINTSFSHNLSRQMPTHVMILLEALQFMEPPRAIMDRLVIIE